MFNYLPNNILIERELIQKANNSGAVLRLLPRLMNALRFSKKTKTFISKLEKQLQWKEKTSDKDQKDAIEWLKDCYYKLKKFSIF